MRASQLRVISVALDNPDALTYWENEFINNLADREDSYELSEKQEATLDSIWDKL